MAKKIWSFDSSFAGGDDKDRRLQLADALECADRDPTDADAWNNLGYLYASYNRDDDAIAAYARGLQLDPGNDVIRYNLLVMLVVGKRYSEALAIRCKSTDEDLQLTALFAFQHGTCYLALDRPSEAVSLFERALVHLPDHVPCIVNLYRARLKVGDTNGAQDLSRRYPKVNFNGTA